MVAESKLAKLCKRPSQFLRNPQAAGNNTISSFLASRFLAIALGGQHGTGSVAFLFVFAKETAK